MMEKLNIQEWSYPPFESEFIYCVNRNSIGEKYTLVEEIYLKFSLIKFKFIDTEFESVNEKLNEISKLYNIYA